MQSEEAIKRLMEEYGPRWHIEPPASSSYECFDVKGELSLTNIEPVTGSLTRVCGVRVDLGHVAVIHRYELKGYQDVVAAWDSAALTREVLSDHSIVGKLAWRLQIDEQLAYSALSRLSTVSEGHGVLGTFAVKESSLQPIIVKGKSSVAVYVRGIDPAAGLTIAPDGGQLVASLSGYLLSVP